MEMTVFTTHTMTAMGSVYSIQRARLDPVMMMKAVSLVKGNAMGAAAVDLARLMMSSALEIWRVWRLPLMWMTVNK